MLTLIDDHQDLPLCTVPLQNVGEHGSPQRLIPLSSYVCTFDKSHRLIPAIRHPFAQARQVGDPLRSSASFAFICQVKCIY